MFSRAFRDNPLNQTVVGGSDQQRVRCNYFGMRATLSAGHGEVYLVGTRSTSPGSKQTEILGALLGTAPFCYPGPRPNLYAQLRCLWGQGIAVQRRWSRVHETMANIHPMTPHWYLSVLGVEPECQHQGIGGALIRHWLARVDEDDAPSYLETDREECIEFYRRFGFRIARALQVLDVPVWCMHRPAPSGEEIVLRS
jgi:ribosomal protein S18 acetylase RimI-like enzyme